MKLQPITSAAHPNKIVGYRFFCPGCKELHHYSIVGATHPVWDFDGNLESPTFSPSLRITGGFADDPDICHLTLTSGLFHFYPDSTHELSGKQDIPLEEYPMSPDQEKNDPSLESGSVASLNERKAESKAIKAAKAVAMAESKAAEAKADEAKTEAKVVEAVAMAEKKRQAALEDEAMTEALARELGKDLGAPESGTGIPPKPEDTGSGPPGHPGPPGIPPEDAEEALTVDEVIEQALRTFEDLSERERLNVLYASLIRIARALYGPDEKVSNPLLGL